jgi:RNA polymerase sigma factor FliA
MKKEIKINIKNKNKIINLYIPLIRKIAKKIRQKAPYVLETNELVSYGVIGLIDAIKNFKKEKGKNFKAFSYFRIKGEMLDYLRKEDTFSRSAKDKVKAIEKTKNKLENKLKRKASDIEILKELNLKKEEYYKLRNSIKNIKIFNMQTPIRTYDGSSIVKEFKSNIKTPCEKLEIASSKDKIKQVLSKLPKKEKDIVFLYYYNDKNFKDIGKALNISESRVSQIHTKTLLKLKTMFLNLKMELSEIFA